jgi:hypothetical protein
MTILKDPIKPSPQEPSKGIEINISLKLSEDVMRGIKQGVKGTTKTLVTLLTSSLFSLVSLSSAVPEHNPQAPTIDVQPSKGVHVNEGRN